MLSVEIIWASLSQLMTVISEMPLVHLCRVLVHAAAGGVGLAAVQMATALGGIVWATAGTPAKRALLRAMGVDRVGSSRSTAFIDTIIQVACDSGF